MANRMSRGNDRRSLSQPLSEHNRSSCLGCNNQGVTAPNSHSLLHRLQALDFSIVDTILYLDAYPHCKDALNYYHKLVGERDALKLALAKTHNRPMTGFENASNDSWDWTNGPWPWEASAN
ncbi:MAG: spore coat protein CotJB [Clostridia bacterium]|nr:spore coat protein CotJB [Clostridia bacterium]